MQSHIIKYKADFNQDILQIWEKSVLATHDFLSQEDFLEIKEMLKSFSFEDLAVFCQIKDGKVIGFIGLNNKKIEMLFLDPDYIGKGFGKDLLDFVVVHYRANLVDVNEQNTRAKAFYEKYGFNVYERVEKDDLGKDYPILKMRLSE